MGSRDAGLSRSGEEYFTVLALSEEGEGVPPCPPED